MKTGAICILPWDKNQNFLCIDCKKKRGTIFPGGRCDPADPTYKFTASREVWEEVGVTVDTNKMKFVCCLPSCTNKYMIYVFWCPEYVGTPTETSEGVPVKATWDDLKANKTFRPFYEIVCELFNGKHWLD